MALGRQILDRPLDAAGNAVAGLPHAATGDAAERHDDVVAGDATNATAITVEAAARVAGDLAHPGTITALTGDVAASGTGSVAATLTNLPQAVLLTRLGALTADPAFNSRKLTLLADGVAVTDAATVGQVAAAAFTVANNAALAALDASKLGDGTPRRVATYRDWFDLDKVTVRTAVPDVIVAASGGTGWWWVRRMEADPSWATQTAWKIDPSGGNDENLGDSTHALKTKSEFARRTDGVKLAATWAVTITGSLNAGDDGVPRIIGDVGTGFHVSYVGVPISAFSDTIDTLVNRNGATRVATQATCNAIPTSWTASGLVGKIIESASGAMAVVVKDLGSKTAQLSPPVDKITGRETTFVSGESFNIWTLPNIRNHVVFGGWNWFTYLDATRWVLNTGAIIKTNCSGPTTFWAAVLAEINCVGGLTVSGQLLGTTGQIGVQGGYNFFNASGPAFINVKVACAINSLTVEGNGTFSTSGVSGTAADIEIVSTGLVPDAVINMDALQGGRCLFGGNFYGTSVSANIVAFSGQDSLVQFAKMPVVTGASTIRFVLAGATGNISDIATKQVDDAFLNRVVGPAGPTLNDNRSQPIANVSDPTNAQDVATKHYVDAGSTASVSKTGHAAESVLVSIAGTVSDLVVAPSRIVGRGAAGDVDALTAAAVKTLLAISFADVTGTIQAAQFPALTGDVTTTAGSLATTLANLPQAVLLTRTGALTAALPMNGQKITGVADPTNPQDAATKHYVDASFSGGVPLVDGNKGDITVSGSGATWLINALAVTFAKMQNIATQTLIGRQTAGTGSPESIGVTGGIEFDGIGNIRRSALTGDVSASAGSAGTVINPNVVTNAQLAQVPTGTLKGRTAAGTGNTSDLTFAAVKTALAISFLDITGTLQAAQFPALTGDVTTTAGSFATTLAATGVSAGTFGDGSHSLTIQVDAKGRVLAISAPSISISAGAVSGLSTVQTGALTGDVTKPAGSGTTTLANIPDDVPMAGDILATAIADPAVPAAGTARVYLRSTGKVWASRDENGNVSHTVRTKAAASHQFLTAIGDDGTVSAAQPSYDDLAAGTAQPWATYQFVWSQGTVSFPSPQDRWLSTYLPADGSTTDRRFPFYGAGKASTVQSLQVCLNLSITSGTTALVTFTLQVNGTDTGLSFVVPLAGSPGSGTPVVFGASTGLTIPDGSMVGIRMSESVIGGPIGGAAYNAHVTLILR